jgi:hypothetical protein
LWLGMDQVCSKIKKFCDKEKKWLDLIVSYFICLPTFRRVVVRACVCVCVCACLVSVMGVCGREWLELDFRGWANAFCINFQLHPGWSNVDMVKPKSGGGKKILASQLIWYIFEIGKEVNKTIKEIETKAKKKNEKCQDDLTPPRQTLNECVCSLCAIVSS